MKRELDRRGKWRLFAILFLSLYVVIMLYNVYRPLPEHISYAGKEWVVPSEDVDFFYNLSGEKNGEKFYKEEIFTRTLDIIDEAEQFIVLDFFLFNSYHEKEKEYPTITKKITDALLSKTAENPDMPIIFITDEVNSSYGSHTVPEFEAMKKAGIEVVETNLDAFRDPNPIYSGFYRMLFTWWGESKEGWLPNGLTDMAPDMTVRSYLKLMNVKANHRKTITTEKTTLISSANPHDASYYFANAAFEVKEALVGDMLQSEKAVADTSRNISFPKWTNAAEKGGEVRVQLLTEGKIQEAIEQELARAQKGDEIWLAMFYLADRSVIEGLTDAAERGADIRLILDTNKNSFGRKKTGLPNIPMAAELREDTHNRVKVRWFAQSPEQFHSKMMYIRHENESVVISGSANHTSRNLNNYNPETDVKIRAAHNQLIIEEVDAYMHMLWENKGAIYTDPYEKHNEKISIMKRTIYSFQKLLHFTTF
ncbi:phospholipase D family protein [Domibacillus sp.]|uniref:phospholipase D family protein n=1 Tax=Domibacillus sp. TaxID=1969783 RepID=UPI00281116AF|nr:phospholipase D family protein [Domibacillus sp.]